MPVEMLRKCLIAWQLAVTDCLVRQLKERGEDLRQYLRKQSQVFASGLNVTQEAMDAVENWFNWEEFEKTLNKSN